MDACHYVESFIDYEKKRDYQYNPRTFNLVRMEQLLSFIGNPHHDLHVIHVAGSKGKGSTAAMIASILTTAGYKVGLYTSPHLISPRERISIGSTLISEPEFVTCLETLRPLLDDMRISGNPPTFFEIYTAMAFWYYAHQEVDIAVLEVGLGGRLDATNTVPRPEVSVITPISLEHTQILGKTLGAIAVEKAGIIKSGGIAVLAPQPPEAFQVFQRICDARGASYIDVEQTTEISDAEKIPGGQQFDLKTPHRVYPQIQMPLLGPHQRINSATAICAVETLCGFPVTAQAIYEGLAEVRWPGRMQVISSSPRMVLDGAHSPASVRILREAITENFRYHRLILIAGFSQDKDMRSIGRELCSFADAVVLTKASDMPRAVDPSEIAVVWSDFAKSIRTASAVRCALKEAFDTAESGDLICVTGSLYLVGEVLEQLGYEPDRLCSDSQNQCVISGFIHPKAREETAIKCQHT